MQRISTTTRRALVALGAASALGLAMAQAQTPAAPVQGDATAGATMAPAGAELTIRDIYDRVEAAGYREIRKIEWEHGRYEVKARDAQDQRVKLYVDGSSGEVEPKGKRN